MDRFALCCGRSKSATSLVSFWFPSAVSCLGGVTLEDEFCLRKLCCLDATFYTGGRLLCVPSDFEEHWST